MIIDRAFLSALGYLCLLAPAIIAWLDGVCGDDEADIYSWFAKKPLNTILMMNMMMFTGFLFLMVAAGVPQND